MIIKPLTKDDSYLKSSLIKYDFTDNDIGGINNITNDYLFVFQLIGWFIISIFLIAFVNANRAWKIINKLIK